jgi:putative ABC transport system permease protein
MTWLQRLGARLRGFLRRDATLDDIEQEMRSHVDLMTEANIARGMDPDAAHAAAMQGFGNLTRMSELAYDVRAGGRLETMWQDLRFGVRTLGRNPGFATVAIVTLALGTGATSAIFSFVQAVVLRPLPYQEPDRLLSVFEHRGVDMGLTAPDYVDWRAAATSFEQLAASAAITANLTGRGEPERVTAVRVSGNYFDTLGVLPVHGRGFGWSDEPHGAPRVAGAR